MPGDGRYRNWWRRIICYVRRLISIMRRMCWWPPKSHQQLDETINVEIEISIPEISPESSRLLPTPGQYSPLSIGQLHRRSSPASRIPAQAEVHQTSDSDTNSSKLALKWKPKSGLACNAQLRLSTSQPLLQTTDAASLQECNLDSDNKSAGGTAKQSLSISELPTIEGTLSDAISISNSSLIQDPTSCAVSSIISYAEQFHLQPPASTTRSSREQLTLSATSFDEPTANIQVQNSGGAQSPSNQLKTIKSSVLAELLARSPLSRIERQQSASEPCSVLQSPNDGRPEPVNKSSSQGSILARLLSQPISSSSSGGGSTIPDNSLPKAASIPNALEKTQPFSVSSQFVDGPCEPYGLQMVSKQLTERSTSSSDDVNIETRPRRTSPRDRRESLRKSPSKISAEASRQSSPRYRHESHHFISPRKTSPRHRQTCLRKTSPRSQRKYLEQAAGPSKQKPSPEHRRKRKSAEICRTPESQTEEETDEKEDAIKKRPFYKIIPATPTTEDSTGDDFVVEEEEHQMDTGESISEIPLDQTEKSSLHDELNIRPVDEPENVLDQTDKSSKSRGLYESVSSQEEKESSADADEEPKVSNRTTTDSSAQLSDYNLLREDSVPSDLSQGDESGPSFLVKQSVQSPLDFQAIEEESSTSSICKYKKDALRVRILGISSSGEDSADSLSTLSPLSEASNLCCVDPPPHKGAKPKRMEPPRLALANPTQMVPIVPVRRNIELLRPIEPAQPTQSVNQVIQVDTHAPHSGRPASMQPLSEVQLRYLEANEAPVEEFIQEGHVQPPRPARPPLLPLPIPIDPIEIPQVDHAAEPPENQPVQNGGDVRRRGERELDPEYVRRRFGRGRDDPSPPLNGVGNMHGENDGDDVFI